MKNFFFVYLFINCLNVLFAADIVIEVLVTDKDNQTWETKNQMHMTLGHIKNVDATQLQNALFLFNEENAPLLEKSISKGFVVESFNTNGFGGGYHILEADRETTARFDEINRRLYDFLIAHNFGTLSDKTTPKFINPKGYTPHIEFLETRLDKIPKKGDKILFNCCKLIGRIQK